MNDRFHYTTVPLEGNCGKRVDGYHDIAVNDTGENFAQDVSLAANCYNTYLN